MSNAGMAVQFSRQQQFYYFGHIRMHNGLQKIVVQGMGAGKRNIGKPRQRGGEDCVHTLGVSAKTNTRFVKRFGQRHIEQVTHTEEEQMSSLKYYN